jgi:hypothetical protein
MIEEELRELLRELVQSVGACAAEIVHDPADAAAPAGVRRAPLGKGAVLEVRFDGTAPVDDSAATIERAARALRACARRWQIERLPAVAYIRSHPPDRNRVRDRVADYLAAFVGSHGLDNAAVTVDGEVVASATSLEESHRALLPFLLRQVDAEIERHKGETAHVEILREDVCAFSFWVNACLVAFTSAPYAPDFVRHRARLVTREIGQLLPHLDDPPDAPALVAPIPE